MSRLLPLLPRRRPLVLAVRADYPEDCLHLLELTRNLAVIAAEHREIRRFFSQLFMEEHENLSRSMLMPLFLPLPVVLYRGPEKLAAQLSRVGNLALFQTHHATEIKPLLERGGAVLILEQGHRKVVYRLCEELLGYHFAVLICHEHPRKLRLAFSRFKNIVLVTESHDEILRRVQEIVQFGARALRRTKSSSQLRRRHCTGRAGQCSTSRTAATRRETARLGT